MYDYIIMFTTQYYIIRKGDFATDGNKKIYYSLFSICLCLEEYITTRSTDCFYIMMGSTFVWTVIESILHTTKTRVIKPMYITDAYRKKHLIPKPIGIFLQGFQEGGVVTTFGLYFGDRLNNTTYLIAFHLFIAYIIRNMNSKQNISKIASKRQINTIGSLCAMGTITLHNAVTLYRYPEHVQRQFNMFFVMTYVCSIWTYIAYKKGFRTVETHIHTKDGIMIKSGDHIDALFILGYDVIVEISIAYLTFFNWFVL